MPSIAGAQPHTLRILVAVVCVLSLFLFFDPIGFASASIEKHVPGSTTTVHHVVLFRFKKDAEVDAVNAAMLKMLKLEEDCVAPNSQRTYIKSISGGRDNSPEGLQDGFTHAFVVQFDNTDDRNYYIEQDPAHKAFQKEVDPILEKVTVLDFTKGVF
ncbi:stress responsive A/B barrel domain-containing protein [Podospora australis]|uniref:Stress responsive A/B barrel domain-containing protein n=1 Tax=Podospora australis TaxID=1536484 RepID=A0AAN6WTC2_9PEZI|nr:stress responsive A/B barrel domain-containing protein [Podospora australis]